MLTQALIAWCLVESTVAIHAAGLAVILGYFFKIPPADRRYLKTAWRLSRMAWWIIILHLIEIAIWGLFYWWQECFADVESAFYFAGITYTTIGYGDLLLPQEWRLLAPVQGLTGILMCGLSAAVFFAVVNNLFKNK